MNKRQRGYFQRLIKEFEGRCVRCGLKGYHLDRDHIIPTYLGGSDKATNIQPLCAWCNSSKTEERFNWKKFRRLYGWIEVNIKLAKTHPLKGVK